MSRHSRHRFLGALLLAALCVSSHAQIRIHVGGAPVHMLNMGSQLAGGDPMQMLSMGSQIANMGSQVASDTPLGKALDEIMSDMTSDASSGLGDDKVPSDPHNHI